MLRALRFGADLFGNVIGLNRRPIQTTRLFSSASTAEASEKTVEAVEESPTDEVAPMKEQRFKQPYSIEAIQKLKLDQYPLYVEREWWKTGKRMTFWATWRQLRDVKRRKQVQEVGPDRMRLKAIKFNTILPQAIRDEAAEKLLHAKRYDHPRLILNMCQFTGRQRGKIKPYRLNRHLFRRFADRSYLCGVQRAMW
ncbi:unnamed protein product [Caenorhabditis bovis]|uniref:Ribosomal protein S14 n=1 Tax=Caenorhabditis bovis TaxID=2654633 RepID=A0A8S1F4H5_9PELO|nr:unnamed protein product [Caenorhabditis bovis]